MAKTTKTRKARRPVKRSTSTALVRANRVIKGAQRRTKKNIQQWEERGLARRSTTNQNGYVVAADGSLQLGALGLVEMKLTAKEEAVLSERVNPDDVMWKPSKKNGPRDIPYLSHPVYTKWFNRAFGRIGWNLVPIGKPVRDPVTNVVLLPYVLHVHKLPVAFAWGEQEYFDRKADGSESRAQSYGDVIESTVASALRRCAKHLGVGLELWDKAWIASLARPAGDGSFTPRQEKRRNGNSRPPAPVEHADLDKPITDEQRLRLWNNARRAGRGDKDVQEWLMARYKVKTSSDITRRQYDEIVRFIEGKGPLPLREPGEDV